jgi:hypothetical protein
MNYSEPGRKGRHVALWQSLFQSATIIGGAINLGLNINQSNAGGLSPKTYLVFVALTCTAPLVAFFVTPPKKVQRVDGLAVPAFPSEGFFTEIWLTLRELRNPRILACRCRSDYRKVSLMSSRLLVVSMLVHSKLLYHLFGHS